MHVVPYTNGPVHRSSYRQVVLYACGPACTQMVTNTLRVCYSMYTVYTLRMYIIICIYICSYMNM